MVEMIVKLVEALKSFIAFMTWGKFWLCVMTALAVLGFTGTWENRTQIYSTMKASKFESGVLKSISTDSENTIKRIATRDPNIVVIQVIGTDFIKLTRDTVYFYSKSKVLQNEFDNWHDMKSAPSPIMVVNEDEQNARVIAILNQQFICVPLTPNMMKNLPSAAAQAKHVCSISVPPRFGDMVGYINIWMRDVVDASDVDYYHNLARSLADEIYARDIVSR